MYVRSENTLGPMFIFEQYKQFFGWTLEWLIFFLDIFRPNIFRDNVFLSKSMQDFHYHFKWILFLPEAMYEIHLRQLSTSVASLGWFATQAKYLDQIAFAFSITRKVKFKTKFKFCFRFCLVLLFTYATTYLAFSWRNRSKV